MHTLAPPDLSFQLSNKWTGDQLRYYSVEACDSLHTQEWVPIPGFEAREADGSTVTIEGPDTTEAYFRLRTWMD